MMVVHDVSLSIPYASGLVHAFFAGGDSGQWRIAHNKDVIGPGLPDADRLSVAMLRPSESSWTLSGTTSNGRYVQRAEQQALGARQEGLDRPHATRASLIPIRKSAAWWELAQDERRAIFEEQSAHIAIGLDYLPAVARRLYHSRDLGEPFDFLTWFEFAPEHEGEFDRLLDRLRATREWDYVEREVELRLTRD